MTVDKVLSKAINKINKKEGVEPKYILVNPNTYRYFKRLEIAKFGFVNKQMTFNGVSMIKSKDINIKSFVIGVKYNF
jgi:hypothetical protein